MSAEPWYIQYSNQIIAVIGIIVMIILAIIGRKRSRLSQSKKIRADKRFSIQSQQIEKANTVMQINISDSSLLQKTNREIAKGGVVIGNKIEKREVEIEKSTEQLIEYAKTNIFKADEPLSQILSTCIEIAKRAHRKGDVYWLERELYGAEEWFSSVGTELRNMKDEWIFPPYREIKAEVTHVFVWHNGRDVMKHEYPIFFGKPVIEIERIIQEAGESTQLILWAPVPENWKEIAKKYKTTLAEKTPFIISVSDLRRILEQIRLRVHKFLFSL